MTRAEDKAMSAWDVYEYREHPRGLYHTCFVDGYLQGYEQAENDLRWHSVDEALPPMDEEVIVLLDEWNEVSIEPLYRIAFGHVVNKEYCEDFSGWNIPGVSFWMPMPEISKEK